MLDAISELGRFELRAVAAEVGPRTFARGSVYARENRVLGIRWDADTGTLTGSVIGHEGLYESAAFFAKDLDGTYIFDDGECTCPVGHNCKHVAAIAIAAAAEPGPGQLRALKSPRFPTVPAPEQDSWEQPLRALIDAPAAQTTGNPLAIELALHAPGVPDRRPTQLMARLMRPGARGGWVNGSLAWSALDSWQVRNGDYRPDHLALARELYAVHRVRDGRTHFFGYGSDKRLDLGGCDGAHLWSLLEEGARLGLKLVHASSELGEVRLQHGELVADMTHEEERESRLHVRVRVDGDDAADIEPLLFLGKSGHGIVCAESDAAAIRAPESRRLRLVRLLRPAPAQLQRLVLEGEPIRIPTGELDRFADEIYPALRRLAPVVSSDGSFTAPEISAPTLVLRARYGAGHAVDVEWGWSYRVGAATRHTPLGGASADGVADFRDLDAERAILAAAELGGGGLERLGLLDDAGRPVEFASALTGMDSMRLTTEALPRLAEHSGVVVEVEGEPPDYRDVGDSLTIGVSTAEVAGERDWFDLGVSISVAGRELPFTEVFSALAGGESHALLEDGTHFSLLTPQLQELRRLIEEARGLADSPSSQLRISRYQAGLWAELAALGLVTEQAQRWQRQVSAVLDLDAIPVREPPGTLAAKLRPYQHDGFGWLAALWELELGGILADDMGLGKTLQALALICHARESGQRVAPFLVVAPTSVVCNWRTEAARFAPGLDVRIVTDTLARSGTTIDELATAHVVVTSYTLLRLDAGAYRDVGWAGVILDEAQYVKNHQAKTYRCVRELAAPFKLAMTGTPMENNLMELWALLSISAPGLFPDPKRFLEQYARPIERGGDAELLARLRRRIKPLLKRRTKDVVARDLPPKQEQTLEVDLHPRHRKLYDTYLQRERQKVLGLIGDFQRHRFTILRSITLLRQLSLHAGLIDADHDTVPCAKFAALMEQLQDVVGGGHRALVFSQFTGFLAKARERLDAEGIGYVYLDGRTRRRDRVIERFKKGTDPVFLISLKAGGFGLNLADADYCFLLDPWWNPATEAQAIDRTHRIGQTRRVMVYRLIARETIEQKVVALARRKAALFSGVIDDGDLFAGSLTADDIRGLLG